MKTFELKTKYGEYKNCVLVIDLYRNNQTLYVGIVDLNEGPVDDLSINIDASWSLEKAESFYVADYKTSSNTADKLVDAGYLKKLDKTVKMNYGSYKLYELTPKALEVVSPDCDLKPVFEKYFKAIEDPKTLESKERSEVFYEAYEEIAKERETEEDEELKDVEKEQKEVQNNQNDYDYDDDLPF